MLAPDNFEDERVELLREIVLRESEESLGRAPNLVFFDFDGTLVDGLELFPDGIEVSMVADPDFVFSDEAKQTIGPNEEKLAKFVSSASPIVGMKEVVQALRDHGSELVIVSDNFDFVIETFLECHSIKHFSNIFAHKARFCFNDTLELKPHNLFFVCDEKQWRIEKDLVVKSYIRDRSKEDGGSPVVGFVGDGVNDLKAINALRKGDVAFVRRESKLDEFLRLHPAAKSEIQADLIIWSSGFDILKHFQ